MKKVLLFVLALMMLCTACAENMAVQIIGGEEMEAQTATLDDVKLNIPVDVPDSFELKATDCTVEDILYAYKVGKYEMPISYTDRYYRDTYVSGNEAEYILFRVDILNLQTIPVDFLKDAEVRVISDDKYEFAGWSYQYNYDNTYDKGYDSLINCNTEYVINAEDNFPINPMYMGHYVFGCTLPNSIINAKTPLRMEIKFAGNEMTYNIR